MDGFTLFTWLDGASPWWWVTFGVVLAVVEMATLSFFLIWPGLAALAVALILWLNPGMSGEYQLIFFAVFGIAFTWAGRIYVMRRGPGASDKPGLNQRSASLVGRKGSAVKAFANGSGSIEIDGVPWPARLSEDLEVARGASLEVTNADGTLLIVTPV